MSAVSLESENAMVLDPTLLLFLLACARARACVCVCVCYHQMVVNRINGKDFRCSLFYRFIYQQFYDDHINGTPVIKFICV